MATVRVATSQYTIGDDVQENLRKLLSVIDRAADGGAKLVAAPEFTNHAFDWESVDECWRDAVDLDGEFVRAVQAKAKERRIYVVFNAPLRAEYPTLYDTNFLIGPDGSLIGTSNKQVLIRAENDLMVPAPGLSPIFETEIGRIGLYSCMDGVIPETARLLALRGAQVLVNTLSSMAVDESWLHIPVRAAENRVWIVAANKAGPMVPPGVLERRAARFNSSPHLFIGPGETPIVAPDGTIIAQGPAYQEAVIFADIDPAQADNKAWADGDLFKDRRPDAYALVANAQQPDPAEPAPEPFLAAVVQARSDRTAEQNITRAFDLAGEAVRSGARLIVLPELFPLPLEAIERDPAAAVAVFDRLAEQAKQFCDTHGCFLAYSSVREVNGERRHTGVLVGPGDWPTATYDQVHLTRSMRGWATAGESFQVWSTPLGRIGMLLGYDADFPEAPTVLARLGADVIVHPTTWRQEWEVELGVPERASENHVSLLSAARIDSPVRRGSLLMSTFEMPLKFAGELNPVRPVELPAGRENYGLLRIVPAWSRNKQLMENTNLLGNRRPDLYGPIVAESSLISS